MLKKGDIITLPNQYERRTFWQWFTRKPKQLKKFKITTIVTSNGIAALEEK